jgi:hypothetical protein
MSDVWTSAPTLPPLDGSESFSGVDATVLDFWRFALSDLRMNNTRGYLAEFLVAKAVGATAGRWSCRTSRTLTRCQLARRETFGDVRVEMFAPVRQLEAVVPPRRARPATSSRAGRPTGR